MQTEKLVDRDVESLAVAAALEAGAAGAGSFVLVSGGLGCGKTALLRVAAAAARERGYRVLMARGSHPERDLPFGLVSRLFEPVLREADDEVARLLEASPRVWPLIGHTDLDDAEHASPADLHALHRFFSALTRREPILVLVDDLQWVDRPSLHWLTTLSGRVDHARVVLMASLGHGEWGDRTSLVEDLVAGCTGELTLRDLGPAAMATALERMVGITPDRAFASACADVTGGNPRLVAAVAAAVRDGTVLPHGPGTDQVRGLTVPSLTSGLHARLRQASPHAAEVARAIAVLSTHATRDRVWRLTTIPAPAVTAAISVLRRMGVVTEDGDLVRITQPLLRTAVLSGVPADLIAQAAHLLHEAGVPQPALADHLLASPVIGDEWVVDALRAGAAAALSDGRPETAVRYLRRALREPVTADVRTSLLTDLGAAAAHTDVDSALGYLTEALRLGGAPTSELFELLVVNGRDEQALDLADPVQRGWLALWRPGTAGHAAGDADPAVAALGAVMRGEDLRASVADAQRALESTLDGPGSVPTRITALVALLCTDRADLVPAHADALLATVSRWRHEPLRAWVLGMRAAARRVLGELTGARQDAREGLATLARCGARADGMIAVLLRGLLARISLELDEFDEAHALLDLPLGGVPLGWDEVGPLFARGRLQVLRGTVAGGVADLLACGRVLESWRATNPAVLPWRSEAALALAATGKRAEARRLADEEVELARAWGVAGPLAIALRAQGQVHDDVVPLTESMAVLDNWPAPIERVRTLLTHGRLLKRHNDYAGAREVLHAALAAARELGTSPLATLVSRELTSVGGRVRTTPRTGAAALTAAERRVVGLAIRGNTNQAISVQLRVQLRTVEIHLTNAYRKLGIKTRRELGDALSKAG